MKTYSKQLVSGEGGEALIALRTSQMGHVYHSRPGPDAGIDGQIELRDPDSGEATNKLILVQSKARERFTAEDESSFRYSATHDDIDYWLRADLPVILVCSHPATEEAWWIDVTAWGADPERRSTRQIHFDKQRDRFDEAAAHRLLLCGAPETPRLDVRRGQESLVTNLLEIISLPAEVHVSPASVDTPSQARHRLRAHGRYDSDWVLHDGNVLSFRDLRQPPYDVLANAPPDTFATIEWSNSDDPDRDRIFVWLLNQALRQMHHRDLRWVKGVAHFKSDGGERRLSSKSNRGRAVVKGVQRKNGDGYYALRHTAARLNFMRLAENWYLSIRPEHHFTHDGFRESRFASELSAGLKRRERHAAVRQQVEFWAKFFARSVSLLDDEPRGTAPALTFGDLMTVTADRAFVEPSKSSTEADERQATLF